MIALSILTILVGMTITILAIYYVAGVGVAIALEREPSRSDVVFSSLMFIVGLATESVGIYWLMGML